MMRRLVIIGLILSLSLTGCNRILGVSTAELEETNDNYTFNKSIFNHTQRLELYRLISEIYGLVLVGTPSELLVDNEDALDNSMTIKAFADDSSYITMFSFDNEDKLLNMYNSLMQSYKLSYESDEEYRGIDVDNNQIIIRRPDNANYFYFAYIYSGDDLYRTVYNNITDFMDYAAEKYIKFTDDGKIKGVNKFKKDYNLQ